jgi:hypothetical protein
MNSFANEEEADFSSLLFINNPYFFEIVGGNTPGAAFDYHIAQNVSLRAVYNAANGGQSSGPGGLFGGPSRLITELEVKPSESSAIRLQYARLNEQGVALSDRWAGNSLTYSSDVFAVNAEWAVTPTFALFGRYGTATTRPNSLADTYSDLNSNTYQVGFSLPDLFYPGNVFGVSFGQPIRMNSGTQNGVSLVPSGRQTNIEVFYNFKLNDRVSLTPDLQFINQPNNIANNPSLTVATLRAVFNF